MRAVRVAVVVVIVLAFGNAEIAVVSKRSTSSDPLKPQSPTSLFNASKSCNELLV